MRTIIEPVEIYGVTYDLEIHYTSAPEGFLFDVDLQALVREITSETGE